MGVLDVPFPGFRDTPAADTLQRKGFNAHLAAAKTGLAPLDIAYLGDSETEGTGVTDRSDRWQDLLTAALRERYQPVGVAGGEGYVPCYYNSSTLIDRWTATGPAPTEGSSFGAGKRNWQFATGTVASLIFWGTCADVFTARGTLGGLCTIAVDGKDVSGVAGSTTVDGSGTTLDFVKTSFPGLAPGYHTLTVTAGASGNTYLDGAMIFDGDESLGIRQWDAARHGALAQTFSAGRFEHWATILPKLVIIGIGTNDYGSNVAPATTAANILTIVTGIRAQCTVPPSFLLWTQWGRFRASPTYLWSKYTAAMKSMAATDGGIALLDIDKRWGFFQGGSATDDPYDLLDADGTHASRRGHRAQADLFLGALTPR